MLGKIYTAVAGMMKQDRRIQSAAGNISNINNLGYKRQVVFENVFDIEQTKGSDTLTRMSYDFNQGFLRQTDNLTDFAISGDAFFTVRLEDDTYGYIRNGDFKINNGVLESREGLPIMARNMSTNQLEEININSSFDLIVSNQGNLNLNGTNYQFELVTFDNLQSLTFAENNTFITNSVPVAATEFEIVQSYVEQSNVEAANEYTELLVANRTLQSNTTVFKTIDEVIEKSIDQVGRV